MLSPMVLILIGIALLVVLAPKKKVESAIQAFAPTGEPVEAWQAKTNREMEDDEDVALIGDTYREFKRAERAKALLAQVAVMATSSTPVSKSK